MPDRHVPDRSIGFGVVAGLDPVLLSEIAREVETLGYGAFWINDLGNAMADGLAGLATVHAAAPGLDLGVGVLPLDSRSPGWIATAVRDLGLPVERLRLGVGSGASKQPLAVVEGGVAELRTLLPGVRIFVSALGPRMSRLAGRVADGVLFNWAVPERLAVVSTLVLEGAAEAGRATVERWSYVRAAVGEDGHARVAAEARRYAEAPAYGRAFEAMGVPFEDVGVAGDDLRSALRSYREVLDGIVVRALPRQWRLDEVLAVARAAAPR